jgi:hypothetical protein
MIMKSKLQKTEKVKGIGKTITFPDSSSFPVHSIFDVWENQTQVCYIDDNLPQILWVPNNYITND